MRWQTFSPTQVAPDFDVVWQQPTINGFGSMCHEGPPFKTRLLKKPRQSSTVVQVETVQQEWTFSWKLHVRLCRSLRLLLLTDWWAAGQSQPDQSGQCTAVHPSPQDQDGSHSLAGVPTQRQLLTLLTLAWERQPKESYHNLPPFEL